MYCKAKWYFDHRKCFNKNGEEITSSITVGDRFFTSNEILEKAKKRVAYTASELKS